MGKSKELFMKNYEIDLEREYLIDQMLSQEWQEEEYEKLKNELNEPITTKIEVSDGRETRVEISEETQPANTEVEIPGHGF